MNQTEFIALIAMMFATIAFSIDSMLPALPVIGAELSPDEPNRAQLLITTFFLGLGIGTLFVGPLSDALGRKPVILAGAAIYVTASVVAIFAESLELVLAARVVQGLGAAAPRVVGLAIMRDLYSGRIMARMMSIAMMIFVIFPAVAPLIGTGIIAISGWRGIFLAFVAFSAISMTWMSLRLPEPLPREARRPLRIDLILAAIREMASHPSVRISVIVQTFCLAVMLSMITSVQPSYDQIFGRSDEFPYWFAAVAGVSSSASLLNAALVVRLGMRRMVTWTLASQVIFSGLVLFSTLMHPGGTAAFAIFVAWQASVFFMAGTALGNLNAIAMEPLGHIAGTAASAFGAITTVLASVLAAPIGLAFNGTIQPLSGGILLLSLAGFLLMLYLGAVERRNGV
ncbi:multidrug effflux MFS transporter [Seohaeicola zhoushanensis]|nr:multidrug effflux MFS transporter [Seohaeicola zhoushanensis]